MRIPEQRDFDTYRRQLVASDLSALAALLGRRSDPMAAVV